jgi:hypothetical protein
MKRPYGLLLGAALCASAAYAQMVGDLEGDLALLGRALSPALEATARADRDASWLAMEELYRLWRTFRRMNIEAHPDDPQLAPDLEAIEERLWAASRLIDRGDLADANAELGAARILLLIVIDRRGYTPLP